MMGIIYTEQSCGICNVIVLFKIHFVRLMGKFCRGVPCCGVYGALFNFVGDV